MTESEYYSVPQKLSNTNTNIIWFPKNDKYEYEYYLVSLKWPNTNTNIIRFSKNDQIRIFFGYPEMTEYEYEYKYSSASQ